MAPAMSPSDAGTGIASASPSASSADNSQGGSDAAFGQKSASAESQDGDETEGATESTQGENHRDEGDSDKDDASTVASHEAELGPSDGHEPGKEEQKNEQENEEEDEENGQTDEDNKEGAADQLLERAKDDYKPAGDENLPDAFDDTADAQTESDDEASQDNHEESQGAEETYQRAQQDAQADEEDLPQHAIEQLKFAIKATNLASVQATSAQPSKKSQVFWNTVQNKLPVDYKAAADGPSYFRSSGRDQMEIDPNDSDVEAEDNYRELESQVARKRKHGEASEEDEIRLMRLKKTYDNAMTRANVQASHEMHDAIQEEQDRQRQRADDESLFLLSDSEVDDAPQSKKQKHGRNATTATKAKAKPAKANKKVKVKKLSKTQQAKEQVEERARQRQHNELIKFSSAGLTTTNLFNDVSANHAREEQPTFQHRHRDVALRQLVASIPVDLQPIAKMDVRTMNSYLKYFTPNGSCYSDPAGTGWKVTGLVSSLSHYQMIGVGWMRKQETQAYESNGAIVPEAVPGGLIADAMGLGKTVMCIANIVNGRPKDKKEYKTTLIVVPNSLVMQWHDEIMKHAGYAAGTNVQGIKIVGMQFSKNRLAAANTTSPVDVFKKFDIVLTTYSEVCREYPKYKPPLECRTAAEKKTWWDKVCSEHTGPLHSMTFHRVVLDEATAIKNHMSITSMACRAIKAKYYWAVSGTPAQNNTAELYPYFKFLRVPNTGSFNIFKQNYCDPNEPKCSERLSLRLSTFMLKRNHADEFLGSKLLPLPKPTLNTSQLFFTQIEMEIYRIVHRRFVDRINGFSRNGQLQKKYGHVLAMITRLRQLTCHPLLVQDTMRDLLEPEDFTALAEIAARPVPLHGSQAAILSHLRRMLSADHKILPELDPVTRQTEARSATAPLPIPASFATGRAFAQTDNTHVFLAELEASKPFFEAPIIKCALCTKTAKRPVKMTCRHSYCYDCVLQMTCEAQTARVSELRCLTCNKTMEQDDSDGRDGGELAGCAGKKPKKMSAKAVIDSWVDAHGDMVPSSKTTAVKAQILAWREEDPGVKLIIYTQFLTMVRILDKMCKMEGWGRCQLHGGMDRDRRVKSIKQFGNDADVNILISTLKTGGMGLNLVMASRVLMIDLWWNSSVEQQAFCRTYRRGQEKETVMRRLAVQETIDDAIVAMQERKDEEINAVMNDGERRALSTKELMQLFGRVKDDENGNSYIVVNDDRSKRHEMPHPVDEEDLSGDDM